MFVSVSVPVKETKSSSDNAVLNSDNVPDKVLVVKSTDLLVSVSVPVKETKLSPDNAVLNAVNVPDKVLVVKSTDLLVNVSVVALPTKVSSAFGIVTVQSAVGSTTVKVVS